MTIIDFDDWFDTYNPLLDEYDESTLKDFDDITGIPHDRLWTEVDDDNGGQVVLPGLRLVNRLRVFATEKPYKIEDRETIEVVY